MNVILFGATGMVGQGVLRECLLAPDVQRVLSIVRSPTGQQHAKLHEIVPTDFYDLSSIESELSGYDACFFTLGVTSAGMAEQQYKSRHLRPHTGRREASGKTQSRHDLHLRLRRWHGQH